MIAGRTLELVPHFVSLATIQGSDCFVASLLAMTKGRIRRHCERGRAERGNLIVAPFMKCSTRIPTNNGVIRSITSRTEPAFFAGVTAPRLNENFFFSFDMSSGCVVVLYVPGWSSGLTAAAYALWEEPPDGKTHHVGVVGLSHRA